MIGPRGERLGIWLVEDGLSTGVSEIIISLLMLDRVWTVGVMGGVGVDWKFGQGSPWFRPWVLLGLMHFWVLGTFQGLEGSGKMWGLG